MATEKRSTDRCRLYESAALLADEVFACPGRGGSWRANRSGSRSCFPHRAHCHSTRRVSRCVGGLGSVGCDHQGFPLAIFLTNPHLSRLSIPSPRLDPLCFWAYGSAAIDRER